MLLPHNPNVFARSPLDRAGPRRADAAWLAAALAAAETRIVPFHQMRPFVIEAGEALGAGWLDPGARARYGFADAPALFLGVEPGGAAYFACDVAEPGALSELGRFDDLRALAGRLSRDDLAMLGCAKSIFEWHARHKFCANCGAASAVVEAGWKRQCPACKAEHFPRFDPVVIMLPVSADRCALGRQPGWPRGMHSALAGFVEPGEAIEEAVARETLEEAGLRVREVKLHSTQPWPFPHSLMIGAIAEVEAGEMTIDAKELESARWFTRAESRLLLAGKHPEAFCPPPFAIAHQLLRTWVGD
jgi:NAD+ diphosphatase